MASSSRQYGPPAGRGPQCGGFPLSRDRLVKFAADWEALSNARAAVSIRQVRELAEVSGISASEFIRRPGAEADLAGTHDCNGSNPCAIDLLAQAIYQRRGHQLLADAIIQSYFQANDQGLPALLEFYQTVIEHTGSLARSGWVSLTISSRAIFSLIQVVLIERYLLQAHANAQSSLRTRIRGAASTAVLPYLVPRTIELLKAGYMAIINPYWVRHLIMSKGRSIQGFPGRGIGVGHCSIGKEAFGAYIALKDAAGLAWNLYDAERMSLETERVQSRQPIISHLILQVLASIEDIPFDELEEINRSILPETFSILDADVASRHLLENQKNVIKTWSQSLATNIYSPQAPVSQLLIFLTMPNIEQTLMRPDQLFYYMQSAGRTRMERILEYSQIIQHYETYHRNALARDNHNCMVGVFDLQSKTPITEVLAILSLAMLNTSTADVARSIIRTVATRVTLMPRSSQSGRNRSQIGFPLEQEFINEWYSDRHNAKYKRVANSFIDILEQMR